MSVRIAVSLLLLLALTGCADDRREERLRAAGPHPTLQALLKVADAGVGARKFRQCAGCHTISKGAPDTGGPNLHGIFGQEFGRNSARFGYTAALRDTGGRLALWTGGRRGGRNGFRLSHPQGGSEE